MTNPELEALAERLTESLITSALTIRVTGVVAGCAASVTRDGDVSFVLIPPHLMDQRIQAISDLVRDHHAVLFVFVYDGYVSHFDPKRPCPNCGGAMCGECRGTGHALATKSEAINVIMKSAWGAASERWVPYVVENNVVRELEPPDIPSTAAVIDPYDAIFRKPVVH